jgi:sugar phosphate isomerase/epimerase
MQRRDFIRSTVAAASLGGLLAAEENAVRAASAPVPGASLVKDRVDGSSLQLSLAAYSFRRELSGKKPTMTLERFVDYCAEQELQATELTEYYFRDKSPGYICALRRRACVNGLAISGSPLGNDFCHPPGPARDKQIAHVKAWIDVAALLGSQTIRVFAGKAKKGSSEAEALKLAIAGLKEVSEYAGKKGVLLAIENHGGITSTADQLLALVKGVNSPWLGVNLDTGNFHTDVYASLEKAAPYAVAVQVKVHVREGKKAAEEADFKRIAAILKSAGYRGYVALEYEAKEDALTAVPRYLDKLREALA